MATVNGESVKSQGPTYTGRIELIIGPMFSGKSTELLRRMDRQRLAGYKTCLVTYSKDLRYSDVPAIATHSKMTSEALHCEKIAQIYDKLLEYEAIGIDEAHFISDIVESCERLANCGKVLIVSGLDGTFQRLGFGCFMNIIPLSEKITKLRAICMVCGKNAAFTTRTDASTQIELIGGLDKYIATCRKCYFSKAQ